MARSRHYVLRRQRSWRDWVKPGRQDRRWQVDGEREYRDTVDPYVTCLDYSWAWKHELEAKQRNHKTRGARARDKEQRASQGWFEISSTCGCIVRHVLKTRHARLYKNLNCRIPLRLHGKVAGYDWDLFSMLTEGLR